MGMGKVGVPLPGGVWCSGGRLEDTVPNRVAILAIRQVTEHHRIDSYGKSVDTPIPQYELADTRMPAPKTSLTARLRAGPATRTTVIAPRI